MLLRLRKRHRKRAYDENYTSVTDCSKVQA
nr:MAG TPA: hypothetical protein [Caudoviricetes sp.]